MEPVVVVALVAVGLVVIAIAVYLIVTARALMRVSSQLQVLLSTVATLSENAPPGKGPLEEINTNLAAVQDLLDGLPGERNHGEPSEGKHDEPNERRHGEPGERKHGEPSELTDPH